MDYNDLENRFSFHPAMDIDTKQKHSAVRNLCFDLAEALNEFLPESREKSLAITKLEEVMFWGNAAIARHSEDSDVSS